MSYPVETFVAAARDAASTAYRARGLKNKADSLAYAKALLQAVAFGGRTYDSHVDKSDHVLRVAGAALATCRAAIAAIDGQGEFHTLDAAVDEVAEAAESAARLERFDLADLAV